MIEWYPSYLVSLFKLSAGEKIRNSIPCARGIMAGKEAERQYTEWLL
jgi:hypothetical protein